MLYIKLSLQRRRWPQAAYQYRVAARIDVGYSGQLMSLSVQSTSDALPPPPAPINLVPTVQGWLAIGPRIRFVFRDNALGETGFVIERSTDGGVNFSQITTLPPRNNRGNVTYFDTAMLADQTYHYRVFAVNGSSPSDYWNTATASVPAAVPLCSVPYNILDKNILVGLHGYLPQEIFCLPFIC